MFVPASERSATVRPIGTVPGPGRTLCGVGHKAGTLAGSWTALSSSSPLLSPGAGEAGVDERMLPVALPGAPGSWEP